jgi:hypothetical protein
VKYYIRVCIGSLISLVCLGFALYALYQLIRGGSCASGGNYVSARECPPGTEKWAWVLPGAIIGGLLSFFLGTFKGFGEAKGAMRGNGGVSSGDAARVIGGTPPFDPANLFQGRVIVAGGQMFTPGQAAAPPADPQDPIVRLQRLRHLLDAGTLSPAEFETAKAKILAEM